MNATKWSWRRLMPAVLGVLLLCAVAGTALPQAQTAPQRVVAVADIHGDLDSFVAILKQARLLDDSGAWIAENATLVQTGDTIDRGPKMREVLDLLMALEKQAPRKNSRVLALLGNHEVMNVVGDLRYVTPQNFASFADSRSEKRREKAWDAYNAWRKQRAKALGQPEPVLSKEMDPEWLNAHPLGYLEHREAFGPTGKYGKWLRERDAVAQIGDTILVHGGLPPVLATSSIEQINKAIHSELKNFDIYHHYFVEHKLILPFFTLEEIRQAISQEVDTRAAAIAAKTAAAVAEGKTYEVPAADRKANDVLKDFLNFPTWLSIHPGGPLWFRGYAEWPEEEGAAKLEPALTAWRAARIVVGHTPQRDGRVHARFSNRVFLIDTGMLTAHYAGGRASALEIENGKLTAIYPDERVVLLDPAKPAPPAAAHAGPLEVGEEYGGGGPQSPVKQVAAEAGNAKAAKGPPAVATRVWLGPDGNALPFKSDTELMEFLRKAQVRSMKDVGTGITRPRKVLLEKDGIQMNAIFRDIHEEKDIATMAGGRREAFFRDDFIFENAAYELANLLGLDNVPPVVTRRINGADGSLQVWMEQSMTETKRQKEKIRPPDVTRWNRQIQTMRLFDNLIFNTDRNMGNILIDKDWKLWMIDHTRAFRRFSDLREPKEIIQIDRELWKRLRELDKATLRAALNKYLRQFEIDAILIRRDKLVTHIQQLISEKGEDKVFFSLED